MKQGYKDTLSSYKTLQEMSKPLSPKANQNKMESNKDIYQTLQDYLLKIESSKEINEFQKNLNKHRNIENIKQIKEQQFRLSLLPGSGADKRLKKKIFEFTREYGGNNNLFVSQNDINNNKLGKSSNNKDDFFNGLNNTKKDNLGKPSGLLFSNNTAKKNNEKNIMKSLDDFSNSSSIKKKISTSSKNNDSDIQKERLFPFFDRYYVPQRRYFIANLNNIPGDLNRRKGEEEKERKEMAPLSLKEKIAIKENSDLVNFSSFNMPKNTKPEKEKAKGIKDNEKTGQKEPEKNKSTIMKKNSFLNF